MIFGGQKQTELFCFPELLKEVRENRLEPVKDGAFSKDGTQMILKVEKKTKKEGAFVEVAYRRKTAA